MTLEDFFTLAEMKNGLSTLARVEEMISVMERQKDCVMNNVGDTARQWSTVAGNLAATENNDCLNHFVELNGLFFLNQWLQQALKFSNDAGSSTMEELINSLLGSLERLPLNKDKLNANGIWVTAEQLLGQKNPNIKERVRNLLDRWNNKRVDDSNQDMENGGTCQDNQHKPSANANTVESVHKCPIDSSSCNVWPEEGNCRVDFGGTESHHSNFTKYSDSPQLDTISDAKIFTQNQTMPIESPNSANANAKIEEICSLSSSHVSNSCQGNFAITQESSVPEVEMTSAGLCGSPVGGRKDAAKQSEAFELKGVDSAKEMGVEVEVEVEVNITEGGLCKASQNESHNALSSLDVSASLGTQKMESIESCNIDSRESKACISKNAEPQPMSKGADCGLPTYLSTVNELKCAAHVAKGSQDLPSSVCTPSKIDGSENYFRSKEVVESDSSTGGHCSGGQLKVSEGLNLVIPSSSSKTVSMKVTGEIDRRSEMELECGEIDALEVARQVALEVEREVVDYREPFCSSSPDIDSGGRVESFSPDLVEGKQDQPLVEELNGNEPLDGKDLSDNAYTPKDDNPRIPAQSGIDTETHEQDFKPELTTVAREADRKNNKNVWDFDLNEDICTKDDHSTNPLPNNQVNLSAPKAIVAALKGALELPVSPLCFEGELGWKGSTARSAFHPASCRRTPEAERTHLSLENKTNILEIDLNVAESVDDVADDLTSVKQVTHSPCFPSGESSMEVSSRRVERLKLDLNRLGDEDMSPHPSSFWKLHSQNGDQSLSTASSSSRHPSIKDFDLNDNPSLLDIGGSHNMNKASGMSESSELDDPAIIMGSRMAVDKKGYGNQTQLSYLGNGPSLEPVVSARQVLSHAHMPPPAYGYNWLAASPTLPCPPPPFGPGSIPFMIDSRGAPVVPQILGSAGLSGARSAMPLLMGVASAPASLNGIGPSQSGLDLNSGMTLMDFGTREPAGFRQPFMQGQNGSIEEQTRIASHASPRMALKRKEPEYELEPCSLGYKRVTYWH